MAAIDHSATAHELRAAAGQMQGTVAERLSDPDHITNRTCAHYGKVDGLSAILRVIDEHLRAPQIIESDGSTHSEAFIPGVGQIQLSHWPRDYFAQGEDAYLALMFAEKA